MQSVAEHRAVTLEAARRPALDILLNRTGAKALKHIAKAARTLAQSGDDALGVQEALTNLMRLRCRIKADFL